LLQTDHTPKKGGLRECSHRPKTSDRKPGARFFFLSNFYKKFDQNIIKKKFHQKKLLQKVSSKSLQAMILYSGKSLVKNSLFSSIYFFWGLE